VAELCSFVETRTVLKVQTRSTRSGGGPLKLISLSLPILLLNAVAQPVALKGFLSDESCARARAEGGLYTGTAAECAKRCVAEGKKIVFIDPKGRRVLEIENQAAVRKDLGEEVEIGGTIDLQNGTVHVDSMKFVAHVPAMCSRTNHSK
jgi:hypothetical protein